jgi:hypothetical protein
LKPYRRHLSNGILGLVNGCQGAAPHPIKEMQMTKLSKSIMAVVVTCTLIAGLSGCKKEGPLERAGKKVDKAVEDIKK